MKVYLVGTCGYDFNDVKYVTLSEKKAKKLFDELRDELIESCKEMIDHIKKENDCEWDIPNWEEDIKQLTNISYYNDDYDIRCDRPYIEIKEIVNDEIVKEGSESISE